MFLFSRIQEPSCYIPARYVFTLLAFFGYFNIYAMRVNLSVAMVAMANTTTNTSENKSFQYIECANLLSQENSAKQQQFKGERYNWDAKTQGLILGSFFYGYVLTQIPGGTLSEKFGAKWLLGVGILVTAVFSLVTPLAASWGVAAFIAVRILEGLGEGVTFPAMNFILSRWAPRHERSRISTIIFTGSQIGNVVAMPISGWLSSIDFLGGWPSVFYLFGTVGCVWFIMWAALVHETPQAHPRISLHELSYIQQNQDKHPRKGLPVPWRAIFTSLPMWAVLAAHFGHNWGFLILLTELPSYLNTILHFNLKENGMLSALPYILQAISAWITSYIADRLRQSGKLEITTIRKVFNSIGLFGPAICMLGITVSGCRPMLIVSLISLAMVLNACIYSGFNITHVDMSPDYSGTLFGITNAISNLSGIIGPAVVGAFTAHGATILNWNCVFYITAAIYTMTAVIYNVFASAELQPWGLASDEKQESVKNKKSSFAETRH